MCVVAEVVVMVVVVVVAVVVVAMGASVGTVGRYVGTGSNTCRLEVVFVCNAK
jgi:hypothetical protein